AQLTTNSSGTIEVNGSSFDGISNGGTINNNGNIKIGESSHIGNDGIENTGTFNNNTTGQIIIEDTGSNGIHHRIGTFTNSGSIDIGNSLINGCGILNKKTFNNQANATIDIDDTNLDGIYNQAGTFTNEGDITTGSTVATIGSGIVNSTTFNHNAGTLTVKRTGSFTIHGINNAGAFSNSSNINIGSSGTGVTGSGIYNTGTFDHLAGIIQIDHAILDGILNESNGDFTNYSNIIIGSLNSTSRWGINNAATFTNDIGGDIDIFSTGSDAILNYTLGTFTNTEDATLFCQKDVNNEGGTFVNEENAALVCQQDVLNDGGTFTNKGNGSLDSEANVVNQNGGIFNNEGNADIYSDVDIINDAATFTNDADIYSDAKITNLNNGILQGDGRYYFDTDWVNDATFVGGISRVIATGNLLSQICGTSLTTFYKFEVNKSGNPVQLNTDIQVNNKLYMNGGHLDLNGNDLTLGTAGGYISNEWSFSYIYGSAGGEIIKVVDLNAPSNKNPGNMGAIISSAANLGSTTIARGHVVQTSGSGMSIERYYDITPTINTGLSATLRFNYFDHELNGITESELELWRQSGGTWTNEGYSSRDATNNYVQLTGIDVFSRWTLTNDANALPVELLSFTATGLGEKKSLLEWTTASEVNNRGFFVEHSTNGVDWIELGFVEGKGTTATRSDYNFTDHYPERGLNYYRLKQVDLDGTIDYSDIRVVEISRSISQLSVFPNPTNGALNFNESLSGNLAVRNMLGQVVWQSRQTESIQNLGLSFLPAGTYLLEHLDRQKNLQTAKFVISRE
ncbi:MAG: T9SS type A sorting domain-containing protein, partial [Bacteroidetes bacterium]|nr:T9SS type A sorting domain-containing protein [Bacteroidota bacterium]